ncbi:MAG: hypothetical protein ABIJ39_08715 [Chloroflexota bacterium]
MKIPSYNWFARMQLLRLLAVVSLLLGLAGLQAEAAVIAAPAAVAAISLDPTSGPPATVITIHASGFLTGTIGEVRWDDATQQTFSITTSSFTRTLAVPAGASAGIHKVSVCGNCYGEEFVDKVDAFFTVIIAATIPPPTLPPPPPPRTPTNTPAPAEAPSVCADLGLGPEAVVIDFESFTAGQNLDTELEAGFGVSFGLSLQVIAPAVAVHSGSLAGRSIEGGEFGSTTLPIRMHFSRGLRAVGMFVGLEEAIYAVVPVTATLSAYGYREGAGDLVLLSTSSIVFPSVPEDIVHCLKVEVAETDLITFATLEYKDAGGYSTFERRLVDDLTLVYSTRSLPVDLPPEVTIASPMDGWVCTGGHVSLTAQIREDRRLVSVRYRIESGPPSAPVSVVAQGPLGFSAAGGDPTLYLTLYGFSAEAMFTPNQSYTLIIIAEDSAGQQGEAQVSITFTPPPTPSSLDIAISSIEITQAIQCMQNPECGYNSVPLYQRKPTLVRIYLTANSGPISGITGMLQVYREGEEGTIYEVNSLGPAIVDNVANPVAAYRGDLSHTLNFYMPPEAIARPGRLRVRVFVNPEHNPPECCYENNEKGYAEIIINQSKSLHIVFVPILTRGTWGDLSEGWKIIDWMSRVYPIYDINFWRLEGGHGLDVAAGSTPSMAGGCGDWWNDIIDELWWLNFWTDDPESYMRYYGLVDVTAVRPGEFSGCGIIVGDEAAGIVETGDRNTGQTAAHEIGHNHGRNHATGACGAAGPDGSYPMPNGLLDEFGVDVLRMQLYPPTSSYDFMGYCGGESNTWVSRYTYLAMASAIGRVAENTLRVASLSMPAGLLQGEKEFLVASGVVQPTEALIKRGFYRLTLPADTEDDLPSGPYTIELADADGIVLFTRQFGPTLVGDAQPGEVAGTFQIIVPWVEGTQVVVFRYNGVEIGRRQVSPGTPSVTVISPNGGEQWGDSGEVTITWQANDPDGDTLSYAVQFSPDNGNTWVSLNSNVADTQLSIDLANIRGSNAALVRVTASDGMNTASDSSDAVFSVPSKGPEVYIAFPEDGATYPQGQPLFFQGYATDLEDGPITEASAFSWHSNRDGDLGQGEQILALDLSPGNHKVTLTVRDSSGSLGLQEISIIIGAATGPTPGQLTPIRWFIVGLSLVGLAVLAVIVVIWGKKGKAT